MDYSMLSLPVHDQLLEFTQIRVHWDSDAIQPSHPLSSPSPFAFNLSQHQGLFKWVSSSHQGVKVLEFQLQSVLPMNIQGWFPLSWTGWISLQAEGLSRVFSNITNWKASILWHSVLLRVQLSHPYKTSGKTIALTRLTFAGKAMSLLFNMQSRLVITFLPRSKCNSMAAVNICSDFRAPKNKVCHHFHCFPIYFPWSDGTRCHDLRFLNAEL